MGEAIGQVLPMAVGVAISPVPIIAVILMLVSRQARVNGPGFVLGWLIGLALIGILVIGLAGPAEASSGGKPATWVLLLELVLGGLLLVVAARQFRSRPHDGAIAPMPKWMGAIDSLTPVKAIGAGVLLSALNPKNLLLSVAAAATIAQTGISTGEQAIAYVVFALIATIGVAAPVVIFLVLGDRAPAILERLKGDGPEQRRDHVDPVPDHRGEAHRPGVRRPDELRTREFPASMPGLESSGRRPPGRDRPARLPFAPT